MWDYLCKTHIFRGSLYYPPLHVPQDKYHHSPFLIFLLMSSLSYFSSYFLLTSIVFLSPPFHKLPLKYLNLESTKAKTDQSLVNCSYLVLNPGSWSEGMGWMSQKRRERKVRVSLELIITVDTSGLFPLRPLRNWEEMKLRTVSLQD